MAGTEEPGAAGIGTAWLSEARNGRHGQVVHGAEKFGTARQSRHGGVWFSNDRNSMVK